MNFCPYYVPNPNLQLRQNETVSYVRILHAAPNTPAVDVYVNNNPVAKNVRYREFTKYLSLLPGVYNIKVYAANTTSNPVIDLNTNIPARSIFTAAAIGLPNQVSLQLIPEPHLQRLPGRVYVRFAHLSPNTPNLDITLTNGTKLFSDVQYKEVTDYIPLKPGVYNIQAKVTGTNNIVIRVPNIKLLPNRYYTLYAVGLSGGKPPLQVLIPLDGNSYLKHRSI